MKKIILLTMISMFFLLGGTIFAKDKNQTKKVSENSGGIIKLEEEEIILMENKRKIKRMYVSEFGKDKEKILKKIEKKVFKRLGVKSQKEIIEKKLSGKYNDEIRKLIKVKRLDQPKLKFINKKGNIIKEITIGEKKVTKKFKDTVKNKEWNGYLLYSKNAKVSKSQKYAVLTYYFIEVRYNIHNPVESKEYVKIYGEGAYATPKPQDVKFALFNENGSVLWEKKYNEGRVPNLNNPNSCVISLNGVVGVMTNKGVGPGGEILYVYDRDGKEILHYPNEDEKAYPQGEIKISPNGKYLAVRVGFPWPESYRTVFFKLQNGNSWKADKSYVVYEVRDDGKAKVSSEVGETVFIDLKKFLGK